MSSVSYTAIQIFSAEQFKESVSEPSPNTSMYITIGKVDAWSNDANPDVANTCHKTRYTFWSNMIGGKKLVSSDIQHVIPRYDWTANTVYTAYDHENPEFFGDSNSKFYVVTDSYNVYKCIANNYGQPSTTKPTATNSETVTETADGYIWKYMYTISNSDRLRFMNSEYMPVKTLATDIGTTQWSVQQNAIEGGIHSIVVTDGGSGYANANTITVSINGDGEDASAIASINATSQTISKISVTNPGSGYTFANVSISDSSGGTGATARVVISPPGGHGSDPLYELGGKQLIINPKLSFSENGKLPVVNDYRQIGIIKDPFKRGTSNISSNSAFSQTLAISTSGLGDYENDELVYQGASYALSTYSGRVLRWDSANGIVHTINNIGIPSAEALVGANSATVRFVSSTQLNELEPNTGRVLYINNIKPITRAEDQQETFQILIQF